MAPLSPTSTALDVDTLLDDLHHAPVRLAVFGEFSAGKTTVLNALIGEDILSVAVAPTTAVPTRVRYGREFNVFIERTGGERLALFEDDPPFWTRFVGRRDTLNTLQKEKGAIQDFLRTWTKEGERADEVERVVIEIPLAWLKQGIELVDTPGVNNEFTRHQGFTEQEARTTDIALLLMDARQGGGKRTEFDFMNEVQKQVPRCIIALNKMDLVDAEEREEFVEYICEEALPQHWEGAVVPPVVGVSALASLHPSRHDEPELKAAFSELTGRLERLAREERGRLILARKGNPEKALFAEARALEGQSRFDRAHRIYFDLLDVLGAAGLDATPAEEGVRRCEEHLSSQVDTLDELNARYNEAVALAGEDPDAALARLEEIQGEKADLALDDANLDERVAALRERIERRDEAREAICDLHYDLHHRVEQHRDEEGWIAAAATAQQVLPLLDTAEIEEDEANAWRLFVTEQEEQRDAWAAAQWKEMKARADACVEQRHYIDAASYLDTLRHVAPYTPFEAETEAFAAEVTDLAETERAYRQAVRRAGEDARDLTEHRVRPERGREIAGSIDAIIPTHSSLYGTAELPDVPEISDAAPALTVDQKLQMARRLAALAKHAPGSRAEDIVDAVQARRAVVYAREVDDEGQLPSELVQTYPDHPAVERTVRSLLEYDAAWWTPPWKIQKVITALELSPLGIDKGAFENKIEEIKIKKSRSKYIFSSIATILLISLFLLSNVSWHIYEREKRTYESIKRLSNNGQIEQAHELKRSSWFFAHTAESLINEEASRCRQMGDQALEEGRLQDAVWLYQRGEKVMQQRVHQTRIAEVASLSASRADRAREKGQLREASRLYRLSEETVGRESIREKIADLAVELEMEGYRAQRLGKLREAIGKLREAIRLYESSIAAKSPSTVRAKAKEVEEQMLRRWPWPMFGGNDARDRNHSGPAPYPVRTPDYPVCTPDSVNVRWRYQTHGRVQSSPAVAGGRVYVGSGDNHIYALDARTGAVQWRYETDGRVRSSPAFADGRVYVGSSDRHIYALDARTGTVQWRYQTYGQVKSSPAFADGRVYVGSFDNQIYALDARTGRMQWRYKTGGGSSSPAVADGRVYVGSRDRHIYALDARTGAVQWRYRTRGYVWSSPAVADGRVYVGSSDNHIYALDARTGRMQWRYETGGSVTSSPVVADGRVYVGSHDRHIYALDARTGAVQWRYETGSWVRSSPAFADGRVYVGSNNHYIYALDARTGAVQWRYETGDRVLSSPAVAGEHVYVGSDDGHIYAFGGPPW
jgi:outer membrane protein assembly factor BamB/signal recognition particle receptor subunit beta